MEPTNHPRPFEWPPGWHVEHVDQTLSTNADLLAVADTAPHRTVRFADHQTAGRGRLDRLWDAPPGSNLLVSLLFDALTGIAAMMGKLMMIFATAAVATRLA